MREISVLGIDLAKNVFHIHGVNRQGKTVVRRKLSRNKLVEFVSNLKPCLIGMEACGSAHYWDRTFTAMGHTVRQMAAQFVKPYVKSNKNDHTDAEAIAEAVTRPTMRFVSCKSEQQQDITALHRVRERLVKNEVALSNELRAFLYERGLIFPQGISWLTRNRHKTLQECEAKLSPGMMQTVLQLVEELDEIRERKKYYTKRLDIFAKENEVCQRLLEVPGIGMITATAIVAETNPADFKNARQFAAYLGLVPRQHSTGGKSKLLGISKRGNNYLRKLLVIGAHTVLQLHKRKSDRRNVWVAQVLERRGWCRTAVAVANKNARILWALMRRDDTYREFPVTAQAA